MQAFCAARRPPNAPGAPKACFLGILKLEYLVHESIQNNILGGRGQNGRFICLSHKDIFQVRLMPDWYYSCIDYSRNNYGRTEYDFDWLL
jgi:hypothetical protein